MCDLAEQSWALKAVLGLEELNGNYKLDGVLAGFQRQNLKQMGACCLSLSVSVAFSLNLNHFTNILSTFTVLEYLILTARNGNILELKSIVIRCHRQNDYRINSDRQRCEPL